MDPQQALEEERKKYGLGASWVGSWPMGSGSFGTVCLFLKQNKSRKIVDRLAIKEFRPEPHGRGSGEWANPMLWVDGPRGRKIPMEVYAMQELKACGSGSEYVVNLRNWRIQTDPPEHRVIRYYMEPCLGGDLWDIMQWCKGERIPEPFLWYCFEAMATAGSLTQNGRMDGRHRRGHHTIIHRDIKAANVFCGPASKRKFRGYPTPKLGDWGLSVIMNADETRPVDVFVGAGTPGHRPVELVLPATFPGDSKPTMPSSKVDVFGVGITIWSLMAHREGEDYLMFDPDASVVGQTFPPLRIEPQLHPEVVKLYSPALVDLVYACTRYHPDQRPSFPELMLKIIHDSSQHSETRQARNAVAYDSIWGKIDFRHRNDFAVVGGMMDHRILLPGSIVQDYPHGLTQFPDPPPVDTDRRRPPGGPTGEELNPSTSPQRRGQPDDASNPDAHPPPRKRRRGGR